MEHDLISLYESNYLNGGIVSEKNDVAPVADDADEDEDGGTCAGPFQKASAKKTKKSMKNKNIGGITYDSHKRPENIFDKILREMNEFGGDTESAVGSEDDVFDADGEDFTDTEDAGDDEVISLSELRGMTLGEIADLIGGGAVGAVGDEDAFVDDEEPFEDDSIPGESVEGNYHGDQGTYDGKAKRQPATTHVKSNGDADFSKQDTGYDPDDTEGSEGSHHGAQGTYDGKAKRQPVTDHVKGNGDANFGKAKTGVKTSSGKKAKNYF